MKLLLNTHSANEYAECCEYAFLDLDPATAALIMSRWEQFARLQAEDESLVEIDYYSASVVWLDGIPEAFEDKLGGGEDYEEIEAFAEDFENVAARTECDRMVILSQEVYWTCYPKHCDWQVETRPVPVDVVRRAAAENIHPVDTGAAQAEVKDDDA